jgi:hypothetical protein
MSALGFESMQSSRVGEAQGMKWTVKLVADALDLRTASKAEPEKLPRLRSCHRTLRLIDFEAAGSLPS